MSFTRLDRATARIAVAGLLMIAGGAPGAPGLEAAGPQAAPWRPRSTSGIQAPTRVRRRSPWRRFSRRAARPSGETDARR